ncbi:unannotated protein [freshwater metagenome]|uniref:Unannotated protein n=1 Tax=freshwater metagenome TaxID=449393 RepID=A0A6J7HDC3_9ZZZZ
MATQHAHSWWAEVDEVRERIERRRTDPDRSTNERRTVRIEGRRAPAPSREPRRLVAREAAPKRAMEGGRGSGSFARQDRIVLWAVLLGFALVLVAAGTSQAATRLGDRTLHVPMEGRDVRHLQIELRRMGLLKAPATAHFGPHTRAALRRFQRSRCLRPDGIAGTTTIAAIRARKPRCHDRAATAPRSPRGTMRARVATWYGPGWYGRTTACGNTLTSRLLGVAHKTLPCGTKVRFSFRGRSVVATVVDRGPYGSGIDYDLTWAAARRLGILAIGRATLHADH